MSQKGFVELKKDYNKALERHNKAWNYLEDDSIPIPDREKWLPEYEKILNKLNQLLTTFDICNMPCTENEKLVGFELEAGNDLQDGGRHEENN